MPFSGIRQPFELGSNTSTARSIECVSKRIVASLALFLGCRAEVFIPNRRPEAPGDESLPKKFQEERYG